MTRPSLCQKEKQLSLVSVFVAYCILIVNDNQYLLITIIIYILIIDGYTLHPKTTDLTVMLPLYKKVF